MRDYDTGATRDGLKDKFQYEGFFSPLVLKRFAEYMHKHRKQSDGDVRAADNWQKGIPLADYMDSKVRHGMTTWLMWDGFKQYDDDAGEEITMEESLCAEMFNIQGMLFELLKQKHNAKSGDRWYKEESAKY